jgi:large subunit ribosomal protein L10
MPRPEKVHQVAELREKLARATLAVSTTFSGVTVAEINALRRRMRKSGLEYRVVKNTLLRLAAQEAGRPQLMQVVAGPTAIIFAYHPDPVEAAKALDECLKGAPGGLVVRGAIMDGTLLSPEALTELVKLPPRPQLLAELLGHFQGPMATLLALLDSPFQELLGLLESLAGELVNLVEARIRQLEEETAS